MEQVAALSSRASDNSPSADGTAPDVLFVINLSASMAPLSSDALRIAGLERFKVFQVSRTEDGRTRYRMRLGFFRSEADAESVIVSLRERYPTAFVTRATPEDQRHNKGAARPATATPAKVSAPVKAAAPAKPAPAPAPVQAAKAAAPPAPATKPAAAKAAPAQQPAAPALKQTAIQQKDARPAPAAAANKPVARPAAAAPAPAAPARTATPAKTAGASANLTFSDAPISDGKRNAVPAAADGPRHAALPPAAARFQTQSSPVVIDFSIEAEARKAPAKEQAPRPNPKPFHVGEHADVPFLDLALETDPLAANKPSTAAKESAASIAIKKLSGDEIWRIPDLDSTQTIRTLTKAEVSDANQPKWYVVQLALSNQAVNFDAMPTLDIFTAYQLYSVAMMEEGKILHGLRLGFFKEAVSAEAVMGYLKTFFPSPTIVRVSAAEQARFANAGPEAVAKDARKVVEIGNGRDRGEAKAKMPAPAAEPKPAAAAHAIGEGRPPMPKPASPPTPRMQPKTAREFHTGSPRFAKKSPISSSLEEKLKHAAQEIAATESGIRRLKNNPSLLSRLVDKLKT